MVKTLELVQSITGEGELHLGDECLGRVAYGFNSSDFSGSGSVSAQSKRCACGYQSRQRYRSVGVASGECQTHSPSERWPSVALPGRADHRLLGKRASLVSRRVS